jgi:hypothetical protein
MAKFQIILDGATVDTARTIGGAQWKVANRYPGATITGGDDKPAQATPPPPVAVPPQAKADDDDLADVVRQQAATIADLRAKVESLESRCTAQAETIAGYMAAPKPAPKPAPAIAD